MKMPNGQRAVIEDAKLLDYCLSPTHPRGRHKARLFAAALGITAAHALLLKSALLAAARDGDARPTRRNAQGQLFEIEFDCQGPAATKRVVSVWIVENSTQIPRLVTCYPL